MPTIPPKLSGLYTGSAHVSCENNSVIHAGADLVIGSQVIIGHGAVVHCRRIGNHVLIGSHATICGLVSEFSDTLSSKN